MNEGKCGKKSRMTIFQTINERKIRNNNKSSGNQVEDSLAICESQLVIDEDEPPRKRAAKVRMAEEPLNLKCSWDGCGTIFNNYDLYATHVVEHSSSYENTSEKGYSCLWENCSDAVFSEKSLAQHLCFHSYHTMLKNVGQNVINRTKLPECTQENVFKIPECPIQYNCEWAECELSCSTLYDFFLHMQLHVKRNPKYCKKDEIIECCWTGCNFKFMSQYKLGDHLRSHTKEKVIACPSCGHMFSSKTKFSDHLKRQLPLELQSYQCSQCSKLFPSERLLRDHMSSHINNYKCTMCDMTCPKPSLLAKHIRHRHINDRPFKCHICEFSCVTKFNLDVHVLIHCPDKLFSCEVCDFRCRAKYGLNKHYQVVHGVGCMPIYQCNCCEKRFTRGCNLTRHLIKQHNFHWPSGHSRFKYKEDADGIFRVQTVRYESLEVTQEMISTEKNKVDMSAKFSNVKYDLSKQSGSDEIPRYRLLINEDGEENVVCSTGNNIVIRIDDVDDRSKLIRSEIMESDELYAPMKSNKCLGTILS